jgi:hypothetical protein
MYIGLMHACRTTKVKSMHACTSLGMMQRRNARRQGNKSRQ